MDIGPDISGRRKVAAPLSEGIEIVEIDAVLSVEPRCPIGQIIDVLLRDDRPLIDDLRAKEDKTVFMPNICKQPAKGRIRGILSPLNVGAVVATSGE